MLTVQMTNCDNVFDNKLFILFFYRPFIPRSVISLDAIRHTRIGQFGFQILDVCIYEIEIIHHVGNVTAEMFGQCAFGHYTATVLYEKQQ